MSLILPCAGSSTRFPNIRPKWMLTTPSGNLMIQESIKYLDLENIDDIYSMVGFYPDYIHIDFVDKTMNSNIADPDFEKFKEIRKKWPNHKIESHIMSRTPMKYIEKFCLYSDVIYYHYEIDENPNEIKEKINEYRVIPGLVLHASKEYVNISQIIKDYREILIL